MPFEPSSFSDVERIWVTGQRRLAQILESFNPGFFGCFIEFCKQLLNLWIRRPAVLSFRIRRESFHFSRRVRHSCSGSPELLIKKSQIGSERVSQSELAWARKGQPIRTWVKKGQAIRTWVKKGQPIRNWVRKGQPIRNWARKGQSIRTWVSQSEIGSKSRWSQSDPKWRRSI